LGHLRTTGHQLAALTKSNLLILVIQKLDLCARNRGPDMTRSEVAAIAAVPPLIQAFTREKSVSGKSGCII